MSKRTVYAVSEGEYSDYRVEVLFTTRALAERHAKAINGSDETYGEARVEEFVLYDAAPKYVTVWTARARVSRDGEVLPWGRGPDLQHREMWEYGDYAGPGRPIMDARTHQPPAAERLGEVWVQVVGTNKSRVEKAFHDRVAKAKADPKLAALSG